MSNEPVYVLMVNKRGWKSLERENVGLNTDYLRVNRSLPEVDVKEGSLVIIDPESHGSLHSSKCSKDDGDGMRSVVVICLDCQTKWEKYQRRKVESIDHENVKISVIMKELLCLDPGIDNILLPLSPSERYLMLTDSEKIQILSSKIGDMIRIKGKPGSESIGIIQYIGPISEQNDIERTANTTWADRFQNKNAETNEKISPYIGTWFGIELVGSQNCGQCDGRFLGTRYFTAPPKSSIFITAEFLLPYHITVKEKQDHSPPKMAHDHKLSQGKSSYFPQSYSQAVTKNNISKLEDPDTVRSEQFKLLQTSDNDKKQLRKICVSEKSVTSERRQNTSNQLDHASFVESLLKKNELSYQPSSRNGLNEDSSKTVTSSDNKPMDIDDHIVCLDEMKPTYGDIRNVYKTEGPPHAEVAFVNPISTCKSVSLDSGSGINQLCQENYEYRHSVPLETLTSAEELINNNCYNTYIERSQTDYRLREHLSKSNSSGYYKINHVNKSPCSSGRRTTDSRDPNVGPISSNTSKSWEASIGSADLGKSASYSSNANDSNQIPSDWHNYSISNNLNRDDTSPLGGPSTSEDINIAISSIEGKGNSDESEFVKHRIEQLNSQSNSQLQQLSSRISGRSTSNTTTSGSFSLAEDSITRSISKEHYKKNQAIPQFIEKKSLKQERVRVSSPSQIHASQPIGDEFLSGRYASVDHLTNKIEQERPDKGGFNQLVSHEQAVINQNIIEVGSLLELLRDNEEYHGVVKWTGYLPEQKLLNSEVGEANEFSKKTMIAGIELEEEIEGGLNGWHHGSQMFECGDGKGVFLPFTHFQPDRRFEQPVSQFVSSLGVSSSVSINDAREEFPKKPTAPLSINTSNDGDDMDFGGIECPTVPGFEQPIQDHLTLLGRNRGIQGHQNSCYLDATLFAMFSFTSIFDCMLYRPPDADDIPEYGNVQKVLREEIVNPLRKHQFVRADKVMKLRKLLDNLTSVKGLMSEEKDPEELLNSLLSQTLKASPFLEISSGQSAYLYQLFVERDISRTTHPTVQELFEKSFLTSEIKLKKVPPVLVLQMPRYGRQFKVFERIIPSQLLDVTDVIEDSPRQCIICGKLAVFECLKCFGDHGTGLDSTAFCDSCFKTAHAHAKRHNHKPKELKVPEDFKTFANSQASTFQQPRLFMELFAVLCIETSHYVSFVKCGSSPDSPWCLFDSMADRKGEQNGYNIPEVSEANEVSKLLAAAGIGFDNELHATNNSNLAQSMGKKDLGEFSKRLVCDAYMAFYQSTDVMMYQ